MIILNELSSAEEYARMCGVTLKTIFYRHRKGSIASLEIDGHVFVDSKISPPEKFLSYHNKKPVHRILLPGNLNPNDFISVITYSGKKNVRGHIYYAMAMMGKIESVVAGDMVFILKQQADQIPLKHRDR